MKELLYLGLMCFCVTFAQAQTLIDRWTYEGGGLDPASYGGSYKPATLDPDAAADSGASISVSNYGAATGLGSGSYPDGYGYFYSFISTTVQLNVHTANILDDVQTITLTFWSGGNTAWSSSFLTLDYNAENTALSATGYSTAPGEDSEYGAVTYYTWVWNVTGLGDSTGLSINMALSTHTPMGDISLTQAVPEPSSMMLLAAVGAGAFAMRTFIRRKAVS